MHTLRPTSPARSRTAELARAHGGDRTIERSGAIVARRCNRDGAIRVARRYRCQCPARLGPGSEACGRGCRRVDDYLSEGYRLHILDHHHYCNDYDHRRGSGHDRHDEGWGDSWIVDEFEDCQNGGFDGYGDLRVGAQVRVADGLGAVIAIGPVTGAEWVDRRTGTVEIDGEVLDQYEAARCLLHRRIAGVPVTDGSYQVNVGAERRGYVSYRRSDRDANDWNVALSI